jgi:parallel beta-helix repeat protein
VHGGFESEISMPPARLTQDDEYAPHDSIYIDSEADFLALGILGTGSPEDPYVISNLWIDSEEPAIEILNVDASFIITDCLLWSDNGIAIYNSQDFIIENNDIRRYNGYTGMYISDSNDFVIRNNSIVPDFPNTVFTSFEVGIDIDNCRDFSVEENTIDRCIRGMEIEGRVITVSENVITGRSGQWGIYTQITESLIVDNEVSKYEVGIALLESQDNVISDNICDENDWGTVLYQSSENNLTKNVCSNSDASGIVLSYDSAYNIVKENRLVDNTEFGLSIHPMFYNFGGDLISPQGNQIFRNIFIDNNNGMAQAADDDGGNGFGYNYWSDWISHEDADNDGLIDDPYPIAGSQVYDMYPLANEALALSLDIESVQVTLNPGPNGVFTFQGPIEYIQISIVVSLVVIILVPNLKWYVDKKRLNLKSGF